MRNQSLWGSGGVNELSALSFGRPRTQNPTTPFQLTSSEQLGSNTWLVTSVATRPNCGEPLKLPATAARSDASAAAGVTACGW